MTMSNIIDIFLFCNENDMLELRLAEHDPEVDFFVIVESRKTFTNMDKELNFEKNRERYLRWMHKIIYLVIDYYPNHLSSAWDREYYTRNYALDIISKDFNNLLNDKTLILSSDLDEIVKSDVLSFCKTHDMTHGRSLDMDFYYYNCNWKFKNTWHLAKIITYFSLITTYQGSLQKLRDANLEKLMNSGWHLSYFLTYDQIALKLKSFSHIEYSGDKYTSLTNIKYAVQNGKDLFGRDYILERTTNKLPKNIHLLPKMFQREYLSYQKECLFNNINLSQYQIITIFYGTEHDSIDVTDIALSLFHYGQSLRIPQDRKFNDYFTDPVPGIYKSLYIMFNDKVVEIPENNNEYHIMLNKTRKTNKVIYYLCEMNGMNCFEDYINSLDIVDVKIFYSSEDNIKHLNFNENIYIVRYNTPEFILPNDNIFVLNTEQMTENDRYQRLVKHIKSGHQIIDYSLTNLEILSLGNRGLYLPYQNLKEENVKLNRYSEYHKYQIAMIGEKSQRRMDIYNKLKDKYDVLYVDGWDDIRDEQIGMCKILLNIHVNDNFQVFEHIRCDRWTFAGKLVISEYSMNMHNLDINNLVVWSHYDDIINIVDKMLFVDNIDMSNEITKITEIRENILHDFVKNINYVADLRKTYIYFHVCCINNWHIIVNDMLSQIKKSGLYDKVNEIRCCVLGDYIDHKYIFEDKKMNIIFHSYDLSLHEFKIMEILYKDSLTENFDVLYIHSKGVRHNGLNKCVTDWVQYLIYFNVVLHQKCLDNLKTYPVVGINLVDISGTNTHYSGNFWWSKSEHIRSLDKLTDKSYNGPEFYITNKKNTTYLSLWCSNIDHYKSEYHNNKYINKSETEYKNAIYTKTT